MLKVGLKKNHIKKDSLLTKNEHHGADERNDASGTFRGGLQSVFVAVMVQT